MAVLPIIIKALHRIWSQRSLALSVGSCWTARFIITGSCWHVADMCWTLICFLWCQMEIGSPLLWFGNRDKFTQKCYHHSVVMVNLTWSSWLLQWNSMVGGVVTQLWTPLTLILWTKTAFPQKKIIILYLLFYVTQNKDMLSGLKLRVSKCH